MAASGKTDLSELFSAHHGIVSDRVTERKKCASLLRDLLESTHITDYITASTNGGSGPSKAGRSRHQQQPLTWGSLFRNVVGYVLKEAEAVAKMEEKSRGSSALQTKKKVAPTCVWGRWWSIFWRC
jgi:hypothetical protein